MEPEELDSGRVLIGLGEAARRLGISRANLYRLAKVERKVRFIQYSPNGRVLFDPADVEEFYGAHVHEAEMAGNRAPPSGSPA